jgi:hypothetical protein
MKIKHITALFALFPEKFNYFNVKFIGLLGYPKNVKSFILFF